MTNTNGVIMAVTVAIAVTVATTALVACLVWALLTKHPYTPKEKKRPEAPTEEKPPDPKPVSTEISPFLLPLSKQSAESLLDVLNYAYVAAIRDKETKRAMIAATFVGMVSAELTGRRQQ